ncbi:heparan-alpha-glucosaminide N-acetyltransferase domain-containing protein [Mycolicibacterium sp. CBMA 234]|uniref:heparan-alpha-glucosaminide N-acetyltransferase domain-containing protein n=1 Tax=Mycolicibacterium sp. CBMA 234 TaxID=1918495 RepID=UPI0012DEC194|nr:heparan-alpha-glucosaminide N-acetyltransferase domain-containing protein [Mycolicibacterium sp. CBMA 234]
MTQPNTLLGAEVSTRPSLTLPQPPLSNATERGETADRRTATRLVGIDLARGLAVFGMYAAHVGPDPAVGGVTGVAIELTHGRSSALFAVLAGVTLAIIAGRRVPHSGTAGRQAIAKIVIRALILIVLGTALTATESPIEVILTSYGLFFLLALPFTRMSARTLGVVAAGWALIGPQVLYFAHSAMPQSTLNHGVPGDDPLSYSLTELMITGSYPALSWMPFVLAGMALGRLDLASTAVRVRLAITGPALALFGYGSAWLAFHACPGITPTAQAPQAWWSDTGGFPTSGDATWLLAASPHSQTTLSVIANTGVAVTIVVVALACVDRLPGMQVLASPAIAVGTMSLTAYVLHVLAVAALDIDDIPDSELDVLFTFIVTMTVLAFAWSRCFRRGPLEYLIYAATKPTRRIP